MCVCVCLLLVIYATLLSVWLLVLLLPKQRPGRGSAEAEDGLRQRSTRSTTRATSAAEPVELFAQHQHTHTHTLGSKIRNQKPVPNLKLATRLRQIKKKLAQAEASKLDVNCALTTLTQTLRRSVAAAFALPVLLLIFVDCTFFVV